MAGRVVCQGVIVPMLTPFDKRGAVDVEAARKMALRLAQAGTYVFVLGTMGEAFSIPLKQREKLVRAVVDELGGQRIIYAGIPSNCIEEQIAMGNKYIALGISAVVVHLPCYYKLTEREMLYHLGLVADGIDGPILLYNIPQMVGQSLPLRVIDELSHRDNIIGIKDTEEDDVRVQKEMSLWCRRDDFAFLIGHTPFAISGLGVGADGWVPAVGNIVPRLCCELYDAARAGRRDVVERVYRKISEVRAVCRTIAEYKYAASVLGLCSGAVLPPLIGIDEEHKKRIDKLIIDE